MKLSGFHTPPKKAQTSPRNGNLYRKVKAQTSRPKHQKRGYRMLLVPKGLSLIASKPLMEDFRGFEYVKAYRTMQYALFTGYYFVSERHGYNV